MDKRLCDYCGNPECKVPWGLCHCGCGETTTVSPHTSRLHGYMKGVPRRFLPNHHLRTVKVKLAIQSQRPAHMQWQCPFASEELNRLYWMDGKSLPEIAVLAAQVTGRAQPFHERTVAGWMKKYRVGIRTPKQSARLTCKKHPDKMVKARTASLVARAEPDWSRSYDCLNTPSARRKAVKALQRQETHRCCRPGCGGSVTRKASYFLRRKRWACSDPRCRTYVLSESIRQAKREQKTREINPSVPEWARELQEKAERGELLNA